MLSIAHAVEQALIQMTAISSDAAVLFRVDQSELTVAYVNERLTEIVPGLAQAHGYTWESVVHGSAMTSHLDTIGQALKRAMAKKDAVNIRLPFGTQAFDMRLQPIQSEQGMTTHLLCTLPAKWSVQATKEERSLDDRLQVSELAYQRLVESCPIAIVVHQDQRIVYGNPSSIEMLNITSLVKLENLSILDFLPPESQAKLLGRLPRLQGGQAVPPIEIQVMRADGTLVDVEIRSMPILHDGRPAILSLVQDISEHKRMIETLERLAFYDPLTGLANRRLIQEHTMSALAEAAALSEQVAVLFIDFDGFKEINDEYGHEAGDMALSQMADRLRDCLHSTRDMLGRLAGDEFVITRKNTNQKDAEELASYLLDAFRQPLRVGSEQVFLWLSIGISMFPIDALMYERLLRQADAAMYEAKQRGGNAFAWFQSS